MSFSYETTFCGFGSAASEDSVELTPATRFVVSVACAFNEREPVQDAMQNATIKYPSGSGTLAFG